MSPLIILLCVSSVIAGIVWWLRSDVGMEKKAKRVHSLYGTARLEAIITLLELCADSGTQDCLLESWPSLEQPLREVLLDATQDHKTQLAGILDACNGLCRNREIARSLMDVRNTMLHG